MSTNPNDREDLNICHICDQKFEELELHFIIFHTSIQQSDIDTKEEIPNLEDITTTEYANQSENNPTKVEENNVKKINHKLVEYGYLKDMIDCEGGK